MTWMSAVSSILGFADHNHGCQVVAKSYSDRRTDVSTVIVLRMSQQDTRCTV